MFKSINRSKLVRWFFLFSLLVSLALPAAWPRPVLAAAGNFVVNSLADNNVADGALTLREALLLARHGVSLGIGLGRPLTAGEQAQTFGCVFDAAGNITAGCGEDTLDFVTFDSSLGIYPWITLASALPPIDDTQPTILNGGSVKPTLDAGNVSFSEAALDVTTAANVVEYIGILNGPNANFEIAGNANTVHDVWSWKGGWGILLEGSNNTIQRASVGLGSTGLCTGLGNEYGGILLLGTESAQISDSNISCNDGPGLHMFGDGTGSTFISNVTIHDNADDGIWVDANSTGNHWTNLSVYNNGGLGIDTGTFDANANDPSAPYPVITSAGVDFGLITLSGIASLPGIGTTEVEVYKIAPDPSGFGEGKTYFASATVDMQGQWSVSVPGFDLGCYTAFQTHTNTVNGLTTSSEFGPNSCRVFVPMILK